MQQKYKEYGERIALFRKTRGYSLDRFAGLIGQTGPTITCWEEGLETPDLETLAKMQDAFELNLTWLATGKEEMLCKKPPSVIGPQLDVLLEIAGFKGNGKYKEFIYAFCSHEPVRKSVLKVYEELKAAPDYQSYVRELHRYECGE